MPRLCVKLKEAEQAKTPAAVIYWAELSLASKIHAVQLLCEQWKKTPLFLGEPQFVSPSASAAACIKPTPRECVSPSF